MVFSPIYYLRIRVRAGYHDVTDDISISSLKPQDVVKTYPDGVKLAVEWYIRAIVVVGSPSLLIRSPRGASGVYSDGLNLYGKRDRCQVSKSIQLNLTQGGLHLSCCRQDP